MGLHLSNDQLRIAVGLRLGSSVCQPHTCRCGALADGVGNHALVCRRSQGRHIRHKLLNSTVSRALQAAHIPTSLEPTGLSRNDGKRPDGLSMIPWARGKCLIWDATCVHRSAESYNNISHLEGSSVAAAAEAKKTTKYERLMTDWVFQPVAVETLGGFGPSTLTFLRKLGSMLSEASGDAREGRFLRQRLAMQVQIGNAACVRETLSRQEEF